MYQQSTSCFFGVFVAKKRLRKRGVMVNRPFGEKSQQLHNRHARSDFETKTQDVSLMKMEVFVGKVRMF